MTEVILELYKHRSYITRFLEISARLLRVGGAVPSGILIALGTIVFYSSSRLSYADRELTSVFQLFGSTLVISGAVLFIALLIELRLIDHIDSTIHSQHRELEATLENLLTSYSSVSSLGVERVHWSQGEAISALPSLLSDTSSRFDILGISLLGFFRDPAVQKELAGAINRGVKVRVLLLDPSGELLSYYASQEGCRDDFLRLEIERSIGFLKNISSPAESQFKSIELRFFQGFTSIAMLAGESSAIIELLLHRRSNSSPPQIQIRRGTLYRDILQNFEELWETSKTSPN